MNSLPPNQRNSFPFLFTFGGGLFLIMSVILGLTNPSVREYEDYASKELVIYAKENICQANSDTLEEMLKSKVCNLMVNTGRSQLPKIIAETTQRRNYILFSIYETDIFVYEFQTIGIFNKFYTIDAHQKKFQ